MLVSKLLVSSWDILVSLWNFLKVESRGGSLKVRPRVCFFVTVSGSSATVLPRALLHASSTVDWAVALCFACWGGIETMKLISLELSLRAGWSQCCRQNGNKTPLRQRLLLPFSLPDPQSLDSTQSASYVVNTWQNKCSPLPGLSIRPRANDSTASVSHGHSPILLFLSSISSFYPSTCCLSPALWPFPYSQKTKILTLLCTRQQLAVFHRTSWTTSVHSQPPFQTARPPDPPPCLLVLHTLQLWGPSKWCSRRPAMWAHQHRFSLTTPLPSFLQFLMLLLWNPLTLRTLVPSQTINPRP